MAEVVLEKVEKVYPGGARAVESMDLHIEDGEFLVLVGPSGCGKSTTLRMIAGLETVTSGTIRIGDRVVNDVHPKDRDIAMVFQSYALYPQMTVRENMAFGMMMRGQAKDEIEERVAWAASTLGLEALLERRPAALSGGQRQRVALGRAIVRKPQVFLFDEPLSNLDARLRLETRAELKRLHRELATTTIYVTHDQEEAMTLGDRVCVMSEGVMRDCASPVEIYRKPADRFVGSFLGTPPMNQVEGEWREGRFKGAGLDLALDERAAPVGPVLLGLRPEAMKICEAGEDADIEAEVDLVEILGSQMDIVVRSPDDQRLVARVPAGALAVGSSVRLKINRDELHLFAKEPFGKRFAGSA